MHLKIPKNKSQSWSLCLNFSYADDISRFSFKKFIVKGNIPRIVAFSKVIKKIKKEFNSKNINQDFIYTDPFKFLFFNKSLIKEITIVGPSYLSIFLISLASHLLVT
tara:strand:- start:148 stop:468 length:321 start_codon:yes stop_codon:yes gene_type:complete